jgi:hypothetical protein
MKLITITGLDANALLSALDYYCSVNDRGNLTRLSPYGFGGHQEDTTGFTLEQLNDLRWRLFTAHEHPEEND